ncbi:TM2 domain-containing protein [Staphylococcus chromogenes]|nr:TM2 domain-containing protein [Staphylococcus chromogenes]
MTAPHNPFGAYDKDGLPTSTPPQPATAPASPWQQQAQQLQQPAVVAPGYQPYAAAPMGTQKSMIAAALLAFFLGGFGIHNFYLGYTTKGIIQLVMCLLGWATAIIIVGLVVLCVLEVWVIVEFIMILLGSGSMARDSRGVPLQR